MEDVYFILGIFESVDIFVLILVRLAAFFMLMPIFASANIPTIIRMAFSVGFAFMVYIGGMYGEAYVTYNESVVAFFWLVATEFLVGFTMAYVIYIVFALFYIMGQFVDDSIGFNMVSILDPTSQIQVPVTGNLLYMLALSIFIFGGGLHFIMGALFQSFSMAPIGTINFFDTLSLPQYIVSLIISTFYFGLRIAMPIVGALLLVNIALGMLIKAMPQMNMFVVGIPLKLFLGLIMLFALLPVFAEIFYDVFDLVYYAIETVILFFSYYGG